MRHIVQLTILALILGTAGVAFAQRGGHRGPPSEAFEACEDLEAGDACTVDTPHGTVEGTCGTGRSEELHCIPNDPPPRGDRRGPPPEAFEACEDLEDGDVCTVDTPEGTVEGTCGTGRSEELHCIPSDRRRRR